MSKIIAGLDMPHVKGIAALVLVSENQSEAFFWLPKSSLPKFNVFLRRKYLSWVENGSMKLTQGEVVDYETILADIVKINEKTQINEIVFDRWGSSTFSKMLETAGFQIVGIGKGFASLASATNDYLHSKPKIKNPVFEWMDNHVKFLSDPSGNKKPDMRKRQVEISGVVAYLMAMSRVNAL